MFKNIIFLDIDGVLNNLHLDKPFKRFDGTIAQPVQGTKEFRNHVGLDYDKVEHLNFIMESLPDWNIVISSSWGYDIKKECTTQKFLRHFGFKYIDRILNETGKGFGRGDQILRFVKENNVYNFVTIEDEPFDINGTHPSVTDEIRRQFEGKVFQPYCDIGLTREISINIINHCKGL